MIPSSRSFVATVAEAASFHLLSDSIVPRSHSFPDEGRSDRIRT